MGKAIVAKAKKSKQMTTRLRKIQPEQVISRFAQEGRLAMIGKQAMEDSFSLGLSVTRLEGNEIVEIFPDGRKRIIKILSGQSGFGFRIIKTLSGQSGFGFIKPNDGTADIFVHVSGLIDEIRENDKVTLEVSKQGQEGLNAVNVKVI